MSELVIVADKALICIKIASGNSGCALVEHIQCCAVRLIVHRFQIFVECSNALALAQYFRCVGMQYHNPRQMGDSLQCGSQCRLVKRQSFHGGCTGRTLKPLKCKQIGCKTQPTDQNNEKKEYRRNAWSACI